MFFPSRTKALTILKKQGTIILEAMKALVFLPQDVRRIEDERTND